MFRNVTPERAIAFIQHSVALTYCWPPPLTATRYQTLVFRIFRLAGFINATILLLPLLYALHVYRDDTENLSKAAVISVGVLQISVHIASCAMQQDRLQRLIEEMEICCKTASEFERHVFQRYVDKYSVYYAIYVCSSYLSALLVILGNFFVSDPLPTNAQYPFPVDSEPLRSILFVHQAIVGLQCSAHVSISIFCAMLFLFAAARFEILIAELREIDGIASLIEGVKKYRATRRYAMETVRGMRYVALTLVTLCTVAAVFSGLSLISRTLSLTVKIQFLFLLMAAITAVFMCALPADHLMEMSGDSLRGAYESEWHVLPASVQKCILLMTMRQPPVVLSIKCIIPSLTLNFFSSFMSNIFSIFTALRIVLMRNENDD
ncbi:uncharacterized protein LOC108625640 [Ceratina calcarata]|uniref:Odorant receptor n=1 Tax=Ceratina calcarata TaxID=156304 RepID=A0AAJ7S3C3_9HYME|nr:uncharacterized protein LOC108625640 [Ceratina calcarata]